MDSHEPKQGNGRASYDTNGVRPALPKPLRLPLNGKEGIFVAQYLLGVPAHEAARMAGYKGSNIKNAAWRLMRRPAVVAAINEGQLAIRKAAEVTTESMLEQFDQDREFAISTKNATAAVRSSELKAKLAGLLIDRQDVRAIHGIKVEVVRFSDE